MKKRLVVVTALFALLVVGASCSSTKRSAPSPAPMDRNGPPNATNPENQPVNAPAKPTAADGLDGALNDLSVAE